MTSIESGPLDIVKVNVYELLICRNNYVLIVRKGCARNSIAMALEQPLAIALVIVQNAGMTRGIEDFLAVIIGKTVNTVDQLKIEAESPLQSLMC